MRAHVRCVQDDIVYSLVIEEYDREQGGWRPYRADDVQLEFVMLDPYLRTFMKHDGNGRYSAHFKVPDVYGVYKFRVLYRRPGYTTLAVNTQVCCLPPRPA
jgi:oligosaccharyltransferase complex subunit beta